MSMTTLLLGAGQCVLAVAVGCIAWQGKRESRRSSLVALVTVLNELRERNNESLAAILRLMSSEDFKLGDPQLRAGILDSGNRLRAIHAAVTEALLHTLRECDHEWGFAGRLHAAFRSQLTGNGGTDWRKLMAEYGVP
jgi:hypothetical protein